MLQLHLQQDVEHLLELFEFDRATFVLLEHADLLIVSMIGHVKTVVKSPGWALPPQVLEPPASYEHCEGGGGRPHKTPLLSNKRVGGQQRQISRWCAFERFET